MSSRKITLWSSDGEAFDLDEALELKSQTIKRVIEDDCADNVITLLNITGKILAKVIEYCKKHVESAASKSSDTAFSSSSGDEELKAWDAEFIKVDQATLIDLVLIVHRVVIDVQDYSAKYNTFKLAANHLNIKGLLDLTCQTVADMIKGKTPEEIRKAFQMKHDFTPEEEEEVRRENRWAFE